MYSFSRRSNSSMYGGRVDFRVSRRDVRRSSSCDFFVCFWERAVASSVLEFCDFWSDTIEF